jgi:hypothetical protein
LPSWRLLFRSKSDALTSNTARHSASALASTRDRLWRA